jgi:tetratricopeptide (TPR) repeat protein
MKLHRLFATATLAAALAAAFTVQAADDGPSPGSKAAAADPLTPAREHIKAKRWAAAIDELKKVDARGSADWNNLMGYSYRKAKSPDYEAAERHYDEALRIDPKHRGALEYSGELYLMKGDLPKAEARLAALDKACTFSCSEYRDLKAAVAEYKSTGKYAAKD